MNRESAFVSSHPLLPLSDAALPSSFDALFSVRMTASSMIRSVSAVTPTAASPKDAKPGSIPRMTIFDLPSCCMNAHAKDCVPSQIQVWTLTEGVFTGSNPHLLVEDPHQQERVLVLLRR